MNKTINIAPWTVVPYLDPVIWKVTDANSHTFAHVSGLDNARLIAAAPQLLEALNRAVQDIDSGWADEAEDRFPWLVDARAAIKAAKGE